MYVFARFTAALLVLFLFYFIPHCPVHAAIVYVPDDYPTIQSAINSISGDVSISNIILVRPGTYYGPISIHHQQVTLA